MAARRHRLILLAYLRDPRLIAPDYPQGLRSIIRENVLLEAVNLEKDVDFLLERMRIESSFAPLMSGDGARKTLRNMIQTLERMSNRSEFLLQDAIQPNGSVDAMVKLYEALERSGVLKAAGPKPK